jgi:hypothetical protein
METSFDALNDKRARWVTPTLTCILHGCASGGGGAVGLTESGHASANTVHISTSVTAPVVPVSTNFSPYNGDGGASS